MGYRIATKNDKKLEHGLFKSVSRTIRSNNIANKADEGEYASMSYSQLEAEKARLERRVAADNTKLVEAQANVNKLKTDLKHWEGAVNNLKNDKTACEFRISRLRNRMTNSYYSR